MSTLKETALSPRSDALRYPLVVFDFDGTLADSLPFFFEVFNTLADAHGFRRLEGESLDALRSCDTRVILKHVGLPLWKAPRVAMHFKALMAASIDRIRLFEGAADTLCQLRQRGVTLAVVSSNAMSNVRAVLGDTAGLVDYYECGVPLLGKRSRLRALVKKSGVARDGVLCIGDEVRDIEAARAERLDCAAVTWGYAVPEALMMRKPTVLFSSFEELLSYVK